MSGTGNCPVRLLLTGMGVLAAAVGAATAEQLTVYTTFHPTAYFTERIGGEYVRVVNPCPPDEDPAYWMPDDETIQKFQQADLIVINGANFEKWITKVALPLSRLVVTTRPLKGNLIRLKENVTHSHGPEGEHTHEGTDGHTWVDPLTAKIQAEEIHAALKRKLRDDDVRQALQKNFADLARDLDELDAQLKRLSERLQGQTLLGNHPAWNYVARRYGWDLKTVHVDPEGKLDEHTWHHLEHAAEDHDVKLMLWEAEPKAAIATKLKEQLGISSVVYAPAEAVDPAARARGANYLTIMKDNLRRLAQVLEK